MVPEGSRGQGFKGSSEMLKNYKELNAWQKSYALCLNIYRITAKFPNEEKYGLTSQIRRSAVSIPFNIAKRIWKKDNRKRENQNGRLMGQYSGRAE